MFSKKKDKYFEARQKSNELREKKLEAEKKRIYELEKKNSHSRKKSNEDAKKRLASLHSPLNNLDTEEITKSITNEFIDKKKSYEGNKLIEDFKQGKIKNSPKHLAKKRKM